MEKDWIGRFTKCGEMFFFKLGFGFGHSPGLLDPDIPCVLREVPPLKSPPLYVDIYCVT